MTFLMYWLSFGIAPVLMGLGMNWMAGKSRGRNARNAFRSAAWGCWLLLLGHLAFLGPIPIPVIGPMLNLVLWLTPAAISFLVAASSMVKEMRAQKEGDFTDAA